MVECGGYGLVASAKIEEGKELMDEYILNVSFIFWVGGGEIEVI